MKLGGVKSVGIVDGGNCACMVSVSIYLPFYPVSRLGTHIAHSLRCRGLFLLAAGRLRWDGKLSVSSTSSKVKVQSEKSFWLVSKVQV